ncbi:unnamed protein product [Periconia digitata]|uniref:Smr domain-containing protein n=1 Tax=Periconia digitata TaxID=1303443 RepID=A0A9W4UB03_9PLEO|nr:unnamed protein product [Periconia digitata]
MVIASVALYTTRTTSCSRLSPLGIKTTFPRSPSVSKISNSRVCNISSIHGIAYNIRRNMVDTLASLEKEYCPPLDPALIHALYLDYSEQPDGVNALRAILHDFKHAAAAEQLTDFDPSGSSGLSPRDLSSQHGSDDAQSNVNSWASQTTETDCTGLSAELASLDLSQRSASGSEDSWSGGYYKDSDHFDTPTKEVLLAETFPSLRLQLVAYTLKKCGNDLSRATDELLNQVYLEDAQASPGEESAPRGIDAFSEEFNVSRRGKKGKKKNKNARRVAYDENFAASEAGSYSAPPLNRWSDADRDVEFIVSRTSLSAKVVTSLYHKNGASLALTISVLIQKDVTDHATQEPHASHIQSAIDLARDFPNVEMPRAIALIRLTDPSTSNAHQLAKALTIHPSTRLPSTSQQHIIPRYTPLNLSDPEPEAAPLPSLPLSATPHSTTSLATTRSQAFNQASVAYRKGRSNPLMRAAAGYYSQVGRDASANLRAHREADADAFVTQQSSSTVLDLHGVTVADATRIAKQATRAWWDALGEQRIPGGGRAGVGDGYRVITGVGRHSEGGRGKLGPAVSRALIADGWRVEIGSGEVRVLGVVRR